MEALLFQQEARTPGAHQKGVQVEGKKTGQPDVMDVTSGQHTLSLVFLCIRLAVTLPLGL